MIFFLTAYYLEKGARLIAAIYYCKIWQSCSDSEGQTDADT